MQWKLPFWLSRVFSSGRSNTNTAHRYESELLAAHARSLFWGLRPPALAPLQTRAEAATSERAQQQLNQLFEQIGTDVVAAERFGLVLLTRDLLERELRMPLIYTLGYVREDGQRLHHTAIEGLEQMLKTGIAPGARISLHAWLTLPSLEIFDPTLWAFTQAPWSPGEDSQHLLFMRPDQSPRSYHPQWVGEGFVRKIGVLKEYEGW